MRVFLVEDDAVFSAEMSAYFGRQGVRVVPLRSLKELEELLRQGSPEQDDIIVLDLGLGDENGMHFLLTHQNGYRMPCIVLSGNDNTTDRVLALELGADDYIVKTTPPREILARLHAVARRTSAPKAEEAPLQQGDEYWQLNVARRDLVSPDGQFAGLTSAEFELVSCLAASGSDPVSRDQLSQTVLRRACRPDDRSLDNLVSRIRRKAIACGGGTDIIKSVRQYGYVFTTPLRQEGRQQPKAASRYAGGMGAYLVS